MEIHVLGCGEAFDELLPNTSLLVSTGSAKILLDCGFTVPPQVWRAAPDPAAIDMIYISHAHADHYFGLPPLLGRMWEAGRTKSLTIVSQAGVLDQIRDVLEYGYRNLRARFQYPIEFCAVAAGKTAEVQGSRFSFARTNHSSSNLAIRIDADGKSMCYSGDGDFTPESQELFSGADLVVHEAYSFDTFAGVHASIPGVLAMASEARIRRLALAHLQRDVRKNRARLFEAMLAADIRCVLPQPGDVLFV